MTQLVHAINREEWINGFQTENTKDSVRTVLRQFDEYLKHENTTENDFIEGMKEANSTDRCRAIKQVQQFWQQQNKAPRTIRGYRTFLLSWLEENDIEISPSKLKKLVPLPKIRHELPYTPDTSHIQKIMQKVPIEVSTFFLVLSCSALRQNELKSVRVCDVDFDNKPTMIQIQAENTKTKVERRTFLTLEATKELKKFIKQKNLSGDDLIFTRQTANYQYHMRTANRRLGFNERFATGQRKMSIHRLRAFAGQMITDKVNGEFSQVIKGHTQGLGTYDVGNQKKMSKDYLKAVDELTVDKSEIVERLKDQKDVRVDDNELLRKEFDTMKQAFERLKDSVQKGQNPDELVSE